MKVLIVNNMAPFMWGGAEELAAHLQKNLVIAGHEAEILRVPFQWDPPERIPSQMLMVRAFELLNVDHVIALKFPAYLIRHAKKTLWLLHQYRQAYDMYDEGRSNLPLGIKGESLRELIRNADNESISESRRVFTISEITRQRLLKYNGLEAKVLPPPINDPELFFPGTTGNYIFSGGRVNAMKRQDLLLEALVHAGTNVRLVIAGPPDSPADAEKLERIVSANDLADRVKLDLRFLPRQSYADYVNGSAAVACVPFNEDYGYVGVEAAAAGKAILTTSDSGGILNLVKHKITGWVAEPTVESLADAMNSVFESIRLTREYGLAAMDLLQSQGISWPNTVDELLR
jgi:glycosyltransferase involved in cell wall biosynthesis